MGYVSWPGETSSGSCITLIILYSGYTSAEMVNAATGPGIVYKTLRRVHQEEECNTAQRTFLQSLAIYYFGS